MRARDHTDDSDREGSHPSEIASTGARTTITSMEKVNGKTKPSQLVPSAAPIAVTSRFTYQEARAPKPMAGKSSSSQPSAMKPTFNSHTNGRSFNPAAQQSSAAVVDSSTRPGNRLTQSQSTFPAIPPPSQLRLKSSSQSTKNDKGSNGLNSHRSRLPDNDHNQQAGAHDPDIGDDDEPGFLYGGTDDLPPPQFNDSVDHTGFFDGETATVAHEARDEIVKPAVGQKRPSSQSRTSTPGQISERPAKKRKDVTSDFAQEGSQIPFTHIKRQASQSASFEISSKQALASPRSGNPAFGKNTTRLAQSDAVNGGLVRTGSATNHHQKQFPLGSTVQAQINGVKHSQVISNGAYSHQDQVYSRLTPVMQDHYPHARHPDEPHDPAMADDSDEENMPEERADDHEDVFHDHRHGASSSRPGDISAYMQQGGAGGRALANKRHARDNGAYGFEAAANADAQAHEQAHADAEVGIEDEAEAEAAAGAEGQEEDALSLSLERQAAHGHAQSVELEAEQDELDEGNEEIENHKQADALSDQIVVHQEPEPEVRPTWCQCGDCILPPTAERDDYDNETLDEWVARGEGYIAEVPKLLLAVLDLMRTRARKVNELGGTVDEHMEIIANKTAENDASRAKIRAWKNGTFGMNTSGVGMGSPAPNQQTKTGLKARGDSKESACPLNLSTKASKSTSVKD